MAFPSSPVLAFTRAASQQEARLLASKIVGPEHLFLALLWPEATPGPTILAAYGITVHRARVAMHELSVWGGEPLRGSLPFSIETERAYEIAERYAEGQPVRHPDLVIGVLSVRSSALEQLLLKLGASRSELRMAVQQIEAKRHSSSSVGAASVAPSAPDVIDLRARAPRSTIEVPGNVEPLSVDERVDALSERVDLLTAEVQRLLSAADGGST